MYEKSLEDFLPHSVMRTSTFYLYEQAHMDFFGTRSCLGASRGLRARGTAGRLRARVAYGSWISAFRYYLRTKKH